MTIPDIQELLARHLHGTKAQKLRIERIIQRNEAKRRARDAALRAMQLANAGDHEGAQAVAEDARQWHAVWRHLGGKGPLT